MERRDENVFSVVIPVYNVGQYLKECIESVINQITKPSKYEIVLIDDGSTDHSGRLCDEIKLVNPQFKIRVIHQENKGLLLARRRGYLESTGEYIINIDSDDVLNKNALSIIEEVVKSEEADIYFYNISYMKNGEYIKYYSDVFTKNRGCYVTKDTVINSFYSYSIPVVTSMCGKVFRRRLIDNHKDYSCFEEKSLGEDTLQSVELILNAESFYYVNECLYLYRKDSGISSKFEEDYFSVFSKIINYSIKEFQLSGIEIDDDLYYRSILTTGCRAITQIRNITKENTLNKRKYIMSIANNELFQEALKKTSIYNSQIKVKYRIILLVLKLLSFPSLMSR